MAFQLCIPDGSNDPTRSARTWGMKRDRDGHREFNVSFLVFTDDSDEGPALARMTPGLPLPGSCWRFGKDYDLWAWCQWEMEVKPHRPEPHQPGYWFEITQQYSTKPMDYWRHYEVADPLLEPPKVKVNFSKYTEEATQNWDGSPIQNSAFESLHGPKVEFDANRASVKVTLPFPTQGTPLLSYFSRYAEHVNQSDLWGMPPRCIKLSNWEPQLKFILFGYEFYEVCLEFEMKAPFEVEYNRVVPDPKLIVWNNKLCCPGWDKYVLDEGTKCLKGHWGKGVKIPGDWTIDWVPDPIGYDGNGVGIMPNRFNPAHFDVMKGPKGENMKICLYDGYPVNIQGGQDVPGDQHKIELPRPVSYIVIQKYPPADFLQLGIPVVL